MSSKAKTQPDARRIGDYDYQPLEPAQRSRLHMLGWKDADLVEFTVPEALAIIKTNSRRAKPGSKAALDANVQTLVAAGIPIPPGLESQSDEEIEARDTPRPTPSGIKVTQDGFANQCLQAGTESFVMSEYTGRVVQGSDPLNAMLLEMEERFCIYKDGFDSEGRRIRIRVPTRRFRWAHKDDPAEVGPAPEPVYDAQGKVVTNGELFMVWMPMDVWKQGRQEPQLARSRATTAVLEKTKGREGRDDVMHTEDEAGPVREGLLQMGRSEANYPA